MSKRSSWLVICWRRIAHDVGFAKPRVQPLVAQRHAVARGVLQPCPRRLALRSANLEQVGEVRAQVDRQRRADALQAVIGDLQPLVRGALVQELGARQMQRAVAQQDRAVNA